MENKMTKQNHSFGCRLSKFLLALCMAFSFQAVASVDRNCPAGVSTGHFKVHFQDEELSTTVGFDADPTDGSALGQIRQDTACAALEYLATVINLNGATPDIQFTVSETKGEGPIGVALVSWQHAFNMGCIASNLENYGVTGIDITPSSYHYDTSITIDFGDRNLGSGIVKMHSDYLTSSNGQFDLYSTILHETMHALGFASAVGSDGLSLTGGPYYNFDSFLKNELNTSLVDCSSNQFTLTVDNLISDNVFFEGPHTSKPWSIYSPAGWQSGSSLSHFDDKRDNTRYLMRPSTYGGDDRLLSAMEIDVLCDLGYTLYGTKCFNRHPLGVDDDDLTKNVATPGDEIWLDVLSNDIDTEGDTLSIDTGSVRVLSGGGSFTIDSGKIRYIPSPVFWGTAHLTYRPFDGQRAGNTTHVLINVHSTFCPDNACNYICNGGFEGGAPLNGASNEGVTTYHPEIIDNWRALAQSPDLFERGAAHYSLGGFRPDSHNGVGNDRYLGMFNAFTALETAYVPLVTPLIAGDAYELSYYVYVKGNLSTILSSMIASLNVDSPVPYNSAINSSYDELISELSLVWLNAWRYESVIFMPTLDNLSFLTMEPKTTGEDSGVIYLDSVSIRDPVLVAINISTIVDDGSPLLGQTIAYTIKACNENNFPATNVIVNAEWPNGVTYISGLNSFPQHTFTTINANSCQSINVAAKVDNTAMLNEPIKLCTSLTNTAGMCQTFTGKFHCAEIIVQSTDISVSSVVTATTPVPVGDAELTYEVTVSNIGTTAANNVLVHHTLPPEAVHIPGAAYITASTAGLPASYALNSPGILEIDNLPPGEYVKVILPVTVGKCIGIVNTEDKVELISLDETDINTINNEASAYIAIDCSPVNPVDMPLCTVDGGGAGPAYTFKIGCLEVTNEQYVTFLNDAELGGGVSESASNMTFLASGEVVLPGDPSVSLFRPRTSGCTYCYGWHIIYDAVRNIGSRYYVKSNYANNPVTQLTWPGAIKFTNWLTIAKGLGVGERAYSEGPLLEDWHPVTISTANWQVRELNNTERYRLVYNYRGFRLPMDNQGMTTGALQLEPNAYNEWHKAAAYDPENGPDASGFGCSSGGVCLADKHWPYGTGYLQLLGSTANYAFSSDPFEGTFPGSDLTYEDTTPVGYYNGNLYNPGQPNEFQTTDTNNYYGLYDVTGNVREWLQDRAEISSRAIRGGHFYSRNPPFNDIGLELTTSFRESNAPDGLDSITGFRVLTTDGAVPYCVFGQHSGFDFSWGLIGPSLHIEQGFADGPEAGTEASSLALAIVESARGVQGVSAGLGPHLDYCFYLSTTDGAPFGLYVGPPGQPFDCEVSAGSCSISGASIVAGFPDSDVDSLTDEKDNCIEQANLDQRDTNNDGFGNLCDPDLNNDNIFNSLDLGLFKQRFLTNDVDADINGDGIVNSLDLGLIKNFFFQAPGPSPFAP